jgi:hypothetical protein
MRKNRPADFEMMALDGWLKLAPGEAFAWNKDTPIVPSVAEQQAKMQRVRGMVLSAGFTVENNLVLVQLADAFGTTDRKAGGSDFTKLEDFLRAEGTGVERRLEGAKRVVRRILGEKEGDAVVQDMGEYRRLRHLCAHRPCWLEGVWDPEAGSDAAPLDMPKGRTVGMRLFIADATYVWEVTDEQVAEWAALLNRLATTGDKVLREILRIDESGKPLAGDTASG